MKLTKEKSEEQALHIQMIGIYAGMLDEEYLAASASEIYDSARNYDSVAVLNRSYTPDKSELLRKQSEALVALCNYIQLSKEITELKAKVQVTQNQMQQISKMFE